MMDSQLGLSKQNKYPSNFFKRVHQNNEKMNSCCNRDGMPESRFDTNAKTRNEPVCITPSFCC